MRWMSRWVVQFLVIFVFHVGDVGWWKCVGFVLKFLKVYEKRWRNEDMDR